MAIFNSYVCLPEGIQFIQLFFAQVGQVVFTHGTSVFPPSEVISRPTGQAG